MELYTSLTRLKMALGGEFPPMTPVPVASQGIIDPDFTLGHGALTEDAEMGLRCPMRGCGKYFHNLGKHVQQSHQDLGGVTALRTALSIPRTAGLLSVSAREAYRNAALRDIRLTPARAKRMNAQARPKGKTGSETYDTMNYRNLRDRCEAQMAAKLHALQEKLGRSPSINDTVEEYGTGLVHSLKRIYGTWDNAKSAFGLVAIGRTGGGRPAVEREAVLRGVRAFFEMHQRFPTHREADNPARAPLICCSITTKRALGVETWREAMHVAAVELDMYRVQKAAS